MGFAASKRPLPAPARGEEEGEGSGNERRPPSSRLAYAAYDVAGVLAAALAIPTAPLWLWRGYGQGLAERLGSLPAAFDRLPASPLWIHAASVGETLAAGPLVAELRRRVADTPIVMSATTLTGRAVAEKEMKPDAVTLLPVDALRIVDRAMRRVRPRCLIVLETEIWPGLLRAAHAVRAPIAVASGCLSERSLRRYRCAGALFRSALSHVTRFGMQTEADAERIIALGAHPERVTVTGSLKASRVAPAVASKPPVDGLAGRPLLVAASTQPGEEAFVLAACAGLWERHRDLVLLLAPRRPERFDAVESLVVERGLRHERRSRVSSGVATTTQVVVLDTVGELATFLPVATAVFVGGTIAPIGGHNVLEPAGYAKPVAFGPHTENVADAAAELCSEGAAVMVREPSQLGELWRRLLDRPQEARDMGARARAVVETRASAVVRTWELIAPLLGAQSGHRR